LLALGLPTLGCGEGRHHCDVGSPQLDPINSEQVTGEAVLSSDTLTHVSAFEATLGDLPEVWVGAQPVDNARLSVLLDVAYSEPQPEGAELPIVSVTLRADRDDSRSFAPATVFTQVGGVFMGPSPVAVRLFDVCSREDATQGCCLYGASSCGGSATLELSREDDLFPGVTIGYTVRALAGVYECLEDQSNASWTLEQTR
jgi:hypothetical protein